MPYSISCPSQASALCFVPSAPFPGRAFVHHIRGYQRLGTGRGATALHPSAKRPNDGARRRSRRDHGRPLRPLAEWAGLCFNTGSPGCLVDPHPRLRGRERRIAREPGRCVVAAVEDTLYRHPMPEFATCASHGVGSCRTRANRARFSVGRSGQILDRSFSIEIAKGNQ